jgi:cobalamin biosynthesis protein CobD/CbiB
MLVLPGPGLVVIALGFALLALEYEWARHALGLLGRGLSGIRQLLFPREGSRARRLVGVVATAGFIVATTALTSAVTALIGTQAIA